MAQQNLDGRPDIAALLVPLGRSFLRAELPLLEAHGVSMWAYAVLTALRDNEASSQASLAAAIGADRTRIIAVLDDLQERKLINRQPDPSDRRSNLLSLTLPDARPLRQCRKRYRTTRIGSWPGYLPPIAVRSCGCSSTSRT